jgi:hypothetical protein
MVPASYQVVPGSADDFTGAEAIAAVASRSSMRPEEDAAGLVDYDDAGRVAVGAFGHRDQGYDSVSPRSAVLACPGTPGGGDSQGSGGQPR